MRSGRGFEGTRGLAARGRKETDEHVPAARKAEWGARSGLGRRPKRVPGARAAQAPAPCTAVL